MKKNITNINDINIDTELKIKDNVDIEKLISLKTKEIKSLVRKIELDIINKSNK